MTAEASTDHPLVSVVIPTRRHERSLDRAIETIVDQDYGGAVEVVVVFDRLPEGGMPQPASEHRSVVSLENSHEPGPAGARNVGILATSGEIVGFLDDDDEWAPAKLSHQVRQLLETGADVAVSSVTYLTEHRYKHYRPNLSGDPLRSIVERATFIPLQCMLTWKRCLLDAGLFDERFWVGEDTDLFIRLASRFRFVSSPAPLVRMNRGHRDRLSLDYDRYRDGFERLATKHAELFARYPRGLAHRYWRLAALALSAGRKPEAREWARRACRADPRTARNWGIAALAYALPPSASDMLLNAYQQIGWSRRSTESQPPSAS